MAINNNNNYKQAIALSGLFQASSLINELATEGRLDTEAFACSIGSIFKNNDQTIESIYGGQVNYLPDLNKGFRALLGLKQQTANKNTMTLRYVLALMHLQKRIEKRSDLLSILTERLGNLQDKLEEYEPTHPIILSNLAGIYEDTFSTLPGRIHVQGQRVYLENKTNVEQIRALLLAGIRAINLWRYNGGKRWHLLLRRKQMEAEIEKLI